MSSEASEASPRIVSVTVTTGDDWQVYRVDPDAEGPQSVTVTLSGGRKVRVDADGSLGLDDGRKVTIDAEGAVQVTGRRKPTSGRADTVVISNSRGVMHGDGNTQVNQW